MKRWLICGLLLVASAPGLGADPQAPGAKGLVVHEWGVFRVVADQATANANVREEWDALPEFVYGNIQGRGVPQHWGIVEIRNRPLVFLHSKNGGRVQAKVEFPGGMPGVWWPATRSPSVLGNAKPPPVGTPLEWDLHLRAVPGELTVPEFRSVPKGHWIEKARGVRSDDLIARFGDGPHDVQREKFLFYDGIFPAGKWVTVDATAAGVRLTNPGKHPVFDVTVVDRREEGKVWVGRVTKLEAGTKGAAVEFAEANAAQFPAQGADAFLKQLKEAGLFADEAALLVDTWKHDLFVRPGLHVFYRIALEEYDRAMPLTVTPTPEKVVRVGLIYHGNVEPDLGDRVAELVKKLDAEDFKARDAAEEKLRAIGPSCLPHLIKIRKDKDLSAEVKKRVDAMLKDWNAKEAF